MSLLDLPAELLREVLVHAVSLRDLKGGLRLRLVNRLFSGEILQVLYETSVLEDYVKQNKIEADQGPEHDEFWQRYLATKIFLDRKPLPRRERNVRDVAERLCQGTGNDSPEALRKCLLALCYQPHRILTSAPLPPFQPVVMYFDPTLYRQRS